jgi:hypothetical protein
MINNKALGKIVSDEFNLQIKSLTVHCDQGFPSGVFE